MKPEKLSLELEQLLEQKGYRLRKEQGEFRGGQCVIQGEKLIVLNKKAPPESHVAILARLLWDLGVSDLYLTPAIRKELVLIWRKYPDFRATELEDFQ
jgi:hypothetical protein